MNLPLALPILIPLLASAVSLAAWRSSRVQRWLAVAGTASLLAAGVWLLDQAWHQQTILVMQVGDWPAPFGITLVADLFSAVMVLVTGIIGLAVAVYSLATIGEARESFGYYPLLHILLAGVCGAFLTGDIFNLYVWFEVMLIASFVLLALGGDVHQLRGAIKYVTLNLLSSAIFLAAVGIIYGVTGSLNMADLAATFASDASRPPQATTLAMLLLITFGLKAALFPLFFWLPASYHTPPVAVSAVFAGLLTKVGVYALIRSFTLLFVHDEPYTHGLLLVLAALTMLTGVMGAIVQDDMRRILSFHIISQIGYMVLGLALFGMTTDPELRLLALASAVFYIVHHIIVKTNLFLISGIVHRLEGTFELKSLGGLYRRHPWLALLFLIPAMSLVGMPPLSGFFAKLAVLRAGLAAEQYVVVGIALLVSLLTMFSMIKIWSEVFWKEPPDSSAGKTDAASLATVRVSPLLLGPVITLASITIIIGFAAQPVFDVALAAAEQLSNRDAYIRAVLGVGQ
jgi:multicomponent Na+:H+ antiporter subunit D